MHGHGTVSIALTSSTDPSHGLRVDADRGLGVDGPVMQRLHIRYRSITNMRKQEISPINNDRGFLNAMDASMGS